MDSFPAGWSGLQMEILEDPSEPGNIIPEARPLASNTIPVHF